MTHPVRLIVAACLSSVLTACVNPGLDARVQADHALGAEGVAPGAARSALLTPSGEAGGAGPAGSQADADRRAAEQSARPVLRHAGRPWIGSVSVPMGSGEKLPSIFTEPLQLRFDDAQSGGKVSLRTVAERITAVTGVAVRLKADVFGAAEAAGGTRTPPAAVPLPVPGGQGAGVPLPGLGGAVAGPAGASVLPVPGAVAGSPGGHPAVPRDTTLNAVAMRWSGSLEGFLNLVADQLNLAWEFRDGVVVIERMRTEFFEVAALEGETDYKLGLSGSDQATAGSNAGSGGGTSSSASSNNEISEHGRLNAVSSILAAVNQIIRDVPGSSAVRSEGSGRIAVTTTKETLSKVRDFIRAENESLLRQAQIQFDVYSVTRNESDQRGIEWNAVLAALDGAYVGSFGSPTTLTGASAANIGFNILTPKDSGVSSTLTNRFGGSSALFRLLSELGVSTQHRQVSLLALNRTWDRKSSLGGRAYVSATLPGAATVNGVGAPGLVTSTVTTGDRYLAQPYILDNHTVLLKFGVGFSSLVNLVNFTSGTGLAQQTVQTPETTAINDQATVALRAGQVLVITGLSRAVATDDRRTLTEDAPVGLGGSKSLTRLREDFIIFVRPTIL